MRLQTHHYAHPAERLVLLASSWLALTLLVLILGALVALMVVRPINALLTIVLGIILLGLFVGGGIIGLLRIQPWLDGLKSSSRRAGPSRHRRVHAASERAANRLAMPGTPPVHVLPTDDIDSFTISLGIPTIFVSRGLVEALSDNQLVAALGHEIGHIKGGHARLLTLVRLPLRAQLAHSVLLTPFALAWVALRWWAGVAELSADRAAAIAAGGPEPVAQRLAARASGGEDDGADIDLHRYLTHATDQAGWQLAEEELHLARPRMARRIIEVARFADSRRFTACLGIVGDLQIAVSDLPMNPGSVGVLPHIAIGIMAGLWLTPIALGITIALGAPEPRVERLATEPEVEVFSPDQVPETAVPDDDVEVFRPDRVPESPPPPEEDTEAFQRPQPAEEELDQQLSAMLELARQYRDEGELQQAREMLEQAVLTDPTSAEAHYLLAWVHIDAGNRDLARAEFTATVNLADPDSEMYREAEAALERME